MGLFIHLWIVYFFFLGKPREGGQGFLFYTKKKRISPNLLEKLGRKHRTARLNEEKSEKTYIEDKNKIVYGVITVKT